MTFLDETVEKKRRVAIYIRVSTAEQKLDGYGLEAQKTRLQSYIQSNGGLETKDAWFFTDTHTGSDLNRAGLERLMENVRGKKFDAVLVWKIDRLSRSLKHLLTLFEDFEKNGVSFISVQENIDFRGPIGKLIFQIFGAIAQFERELIKGRTQLGKLMSAELGNYTGTSIPFGYSEKTNAGGRGKKLEVIPEEKKWVEQIFHWYIYEDFGFGEIAKKLNEAGVKKHNHTRTQRAGTQWTNVMVRTILQNSIYRGKFVANKRDEIGNLLPEDKWTIVKVPACVSEFVFQQAQVARKGRKGGHADSIYLLSGKLVDIDLDRPKMFSGAKRSRGGFSYRRKQFMDKQGTHYPVFEIAGKQMEEYVWEKIVEALKSPEVFIRNYLSREFADPSRIERLQNELDSLRERSANTEIAMGRIEHAYEVGQYSQEKMSSKLVERNEELSKIEMRISDIEDEMRVISSVDVEVGKLKDASEQVRFRLDKLDRKQKQRLCNLFVEKIEMRRKMVEGRWKVTAQIFFRFNPDKFASAPDEGRTAKDHQKANNGAFLEKSVKDGGRWLI